MLLNTRNEIQQYVALTNSFPEKSFDSFIRKATQDFLEPAISIKELATIEAAADTHKVLVDCLRRSLANFAVYLYLPFAQVEIGSEGITQARSASKVAARTEDVETMRLALLKTGYEELEKALAILEKTPLAFPDWVLSPGYTLYESSLLPSATAFHQYVHIHRSRRLYLALVPSIRDVQHTSIIPAISAPVYALMKQPVTPAQKSLATNYVLPALANLAYADALPELVLLPGYDTLLTFNNTGANQTKGFQAAPVALVERIAAHYRDRGQRALAGAVEFLQANAADFPEYEQPTNPSGSLGIEYEAGWRVVPFL